MALLLLSTFHASEQYDIAMNHFSISHEAKYFNLVSQIFYPLTFVQYVKFRPIELIKQMSILLFLSLLTLTYTQCNFACTSCVYQVSLGVTTTNCTECAQGYYLEASTCYQCDQAHYQTCKAYFDKSQRARTTIILSIFSFVIVLILVILCCCLSKKYKCCTYQQQPALPQNEINQRTLSYFAPINLSVSEIEMKKFIGQKTWTTSDNIINREQECAVCLESGVFLQTNCKHRFHTGCIWQWIARNHDTCPLCKSQEIIPFRIFCHRCTKSYFQVNFILNQSNSQIKQWQICPTCSKQ